MRNTETTRTYNITLKGDEANLFRHWLNKMEVAHTEDTDHIATTTFNFEANREQISKLNRLCNDSMIDIMFAYI